MEPSIFEAGRQEADDQDMDGMDNTIETQTTDVDVARTEVEQTRCEIGGTLNAIKEKLDPPTLMQQAKETVLDTADQLREKARDTVVDITDHATGAVHDATIGRAQHAIGGVVHTAQHTGESIMDTVRENPLPIALIGLGLGWLMMNQRRHPHQHWTRDYNYALPYQDRMSGGNYGAQGYNPGYGQGYPQQGNAQQGYGQSYAPSYGAQGYSGGAQTTGNPVSERLGDLKDQAGNMAGQVQERVSSAAGQVQGRVSDVAGRVQDRVGQFAGTVQERATLLKYEAGDKVQWAQDSVQRTMQENPVAIGVVALGIGALVGLMLPTTEPENRFMGETRDRLVEQGQQMAQGVAQKVSAVAQDTVQAAKDTAQQSVKDQGLAA